MRNADHNTIEGFGREWAKFDQSALSAEELHQIGEQYFGIFPLKELGHSAEGFDMGCGSGRWAKLVAPYVGKLHCIDASPEALDVARRNLAGVANCIFHHAAVDQLPLEDGSMDFGYSLGVLHHVPATQEGLRSCVSKLRTGAPFLVYLYYAFDNRPQWFRLLWRVTDKLRQFISTTPYWFRNFTTTVIALLIYLPLARLALLMELAGLPVASVPLSYYRSRSIYTMRTDALDRFGTSLEQRFTASEIEEMMRNCGLGSITFSEQAPFWCAVGYRLG